MISFLKKKKEPETLEDALKEISELKRELKNASEEIKALKEQSAFFVSKIGIVRYNPFSSAGGDQSFSMAILDKNGTGAVVTSLYALEGNRVYGKPVEKGKSSYSLSEEEKKAINEAVNGGK
ncbi:MAG: hypothetical protein A2365_00005 [Candidatus Nealsonbacteria bacterium RIFOXYB1_FULL_40_15]|uniref:DUF4446 domain-containing protein n=2 Tax=Candidatus Nealsoniibacteriota TaxID=1817911 RepID=A0A1G2ETN2_9BACT|nr:MAG: hypothetical protein A2365_00005 [Candidatus Nealsonbacteria bacterium RIFOXYB1_FULL_40_15]OGZ28344.1 MAG: hypothetical protein A2562_00455 [Candidatus Nealsonbacteria bacterium RIFOXYD1_FULL_39_11]OGZ29144.1 MAG: hypothetical protein A2427_03570 [Candidatus Nealsonbacteria bacterium RIFOXYC1_FULL_40_7]